MQRHRYRGKFPMDAPAIANVITMQYHRYRGKFPMDTSAIANVATTQRCKRCTFDSPGLASAYPGLCM